MRYLGAALHHKQLFINDYRPLLQSIQTRINNWATRQLSYAGRALLIETVLQSIVRFWATLFSFPKRLIEAPECICHQFLWSGLVDSVKQPAVSWSVVCNPMEQDSLGFKELLSWNKALMMCSVVDKFRDNG